MVLIIITLSFVAKDAADKPANNSKFPKKQGILLSFLGKSIANPRKRPLSPLPFDSAKKPKKELSTNENSQLDWSTIENVLELTEKVPSIYFDKQIEEYLLTPLQNTLLPPHFCGLADKSTVHRVTNQGVVITTMVKGIKMAIAVQAPAVYNGADEDQSEGVTGACAPQLAETMYDTIKKAYPRLAEKLGNSWQGSVLDGQYQAKGFAEKLNSLLKKPESEFVDVVWDPPHWTNLAIEDVFEGKVGKSKEFMKRLISINPNYVFLNA